MTRAMILCAGLGTRLGALSTQRPKPMLPVCDRPILEYGITNLVAHGITDLVINLHHRGDVIETVLGNGSRLGARIQYSHEPTILGTGGGLKHALPLLDPHATDEPFLSLNGKLIFDVDLTAVLAAYEPSLLGLMVVRRVPDAKSWGAVQVDPTGAITDIRGDGDHMFLGVHVTRPSIIAALPDGETDLVTHCYLPGIRAGRRLAAFEHPAGYFAEHSTPSRVVASNLALAAGAHLTHPPGGLGRIDPTARIHPSATLSGAIHIGAWARIGANTTLTDAVIGERAIVDPNITLQRSVVWDNTHLTTSVSDAIVTPDGIVDARP